MLKGNVAVLIVVLSLLSFGVADSAPEGYPMMCKGGDGASLKIVSNASGTNATFYFKRSQNKGLENIAYGRCAWMDRPVNSKEPTEIFMQFPGVITSIRARYDGVDRHSLTYELLGGGRRSDRDALRMLISAYEGPGTFYVTAYLDRTNNVFRISKFGR